MGVLDNLVAPERDPKEEPQRRDGLVDGRHANAARRQMQLVAAHVLEARRIRRSPEKRSEVLDPLHVVMLGLRCELADRHVFDHAPAQRAYCLVGHGDAPVLGEGCEPLISRQDAPLRYPLGRVASRSVLPRERFSPLDPLWTLDSKYRTSAMGGMASFVDGRNEQKVPRSGHLVQLGLGVLRRPSTVCRGDISGSCRSPYLQSLGQIRMESYDDELKNFEAHGAAPLPTASNQGFVEHNGARIRYATYGS